MEELVMRMAMCAACVFGVPVIPALAQRSQAAFFPQGHSVKITRGEYLADTECTIAELGLG
jgi:hypothetical protein